MQNFKSEGIVFGVWEAPSFYDLIVFINPSKWIGCRKFAYKANRTLKQTREAKKYEEKMNSKSSNRYISPVNCEPVEKKINYTREKDVMQGKCENWDRYEGFVEYEEVMGIHSYSQNADDEASLNNEENET